jgi:hypothetical protein
MTGRPHGVDPRQPRRGRGNIEQYLRGRQAGRGASPPNIGGRRGGTGSGCTPWLLAAIALGGLALFVWSVAR